MTDEEQKLADEQIKAIEDTGDKDIDRLKHEGVSSVLPSGTKLTEKRSIKIGAIENEAIFSEKEVLSEDDAPHVDVQKPVTPFAGPTLRVIHGGLSSGTTQESVINPEKNEMRADGLFQKNESKEGVNEREKIKKIYERLKAIESSLHTLIGRFASDTERTPMLAHEQRSAEIDLVAVVKAYEARKNSESFLRVGEFRRLYEQAGSMIDEELEKASQQRGLSDFSKKIGKFFNNMTAGIQIKMAVTTVFRSLFSGDEKYKTMPVATGLNDGVATMVISEGARPESEIVQDAHKAALMQKGSAEHVSAAARFFKRLDERSQKQYEAKVLADREIAKHSGILFEYVTQETETLWSVIYRTHSLAMIDFNDEVLPEYKKQFLIAYMIKQVDRMSQERRKEIFGFENIDAIESGTHINLEAFYQTGAWHYALDILSQLSDEQLSEIEERYIDGRISRTHGTQEAADKYLPDLSTNITVLGSYEEIEEMIKNKSDTEYD